MTLGRATGALLLGLGLLAGCASRPLPPEPPPSGMRVHVVQRGETVWRISQRYGTTVEAIARANGLRDPTQVQAGQRLYIPTSTRSARLPRSGDVYRSRDPRGRSAALEFMWPIRGRVSSRFGMRDGAHHDGIDIPARRGTPIRAAEAGRVVHSGNSLAGYGNMVIVKHAGAFSTVYAHNRKNLVKVGDFVTKGQTIAEVGKTGRASAPHVHFEVRRNGSPRDPLHYLP